MLDLQFVRKNLDLVAESLEKRGTKLSLDPLRELDEKRRSLLFQVEDLKKTRNENSKKIGEFIRAGEDAEPLKKEMRAVGDQITKMEEELKLVEEQFLAFMHELPNIPADSVPRGVTPDDNRVERVRGQKPSFDFEPKPHWDLGTELGILDFERAAKISGARFALYLGQGARLERALIQFMLDLHTRHHGYTEVLPPFLVNADAMFGTGQLPKFEDDSFKTYPGNFYLIPTAEVPVTNIYANEILEPDSLPIAFCAYTPCFRSEAGSYGKDVRGLIRQHQFNKVELVRFTEPEDSADQLELLTTHAEEVLRLLGLHYRVVSLCTGDLGFSATKTYDLEVWIPSQDVYREISSCSSFGDFQARRAKIRYRPSQGAKSVLVHTLNGSGLAVGRTLVAILENYQQEDGSVVIPEALRPYMDGLDRIEARR